MMMSEKEVGHVLTGFAAPAMSSGAEAASPMCGEKLWRRCTTPAWLRHCVVSSGGDPRGLVPWRQQHCRTGGANDRCDSSVAEPVAPASLMAQGNIMEPAAPRGPVED